MVLFNHATREMTAKIVYYGPGLCGKTTNLMVIFDKLDEKSRGKMLSLATKSDRTLFFDLLPVDIGKVGPFNLKIQLYTVPGQVFYNETRKLVLKGADAVVFVADSQQSMIESTKESFRNLLENLDENEIDADAIPIIIQYNKRDIPGVPSVEDLQRQLGFTGLPGVPAAALKGEGVMETFKLSTKITAKYLVGKVKGKVVAVRDFSLKDWPNVPGIEASAPIPEPEPEIEEPVEEIAEEAPSLDVNPFADSLSPSTSEAPFEPAVDADYDQVQEISLEDLLVGRERPETLSGNVAIPIDVSALEETPLEIAVDDDIDDVEAIEETAVVAVEGPAGDSDELRAENERLRAAISRIVDELSELIGR